MNFSHLNFGNNFLSMQQFSTATKVVENVQQNVAFIPAPSTQHYHNHSNQLSFPNSVQVTTAVIQQQHHYQDSLPRTINQNVTSHSANTTSTTSTAAQTQWPEVVNRISNENVKVNPGLQNFLQPAHGNHITIQRPSRTVVMQSVSTMTEFDYSVTLGSKNPQKYTTSDESDESSKSSTIDNQQFQASSCSNSCSKIHLKSNASAMAEYLNRLQPSSIPPMIQDFLKRHNIEVNLNKVDKIPCNKDSEDNIKNKPEIRLSTALDGSLLYCCPECHMAYPVKELLERHLSVHKAERKFECNVCGVCLKRKEHLDQHKRGHSEERPFVCEICCKGFKRNEHLRRHIVIHSGDKSHVCIQCGKAFSRKDHLNKHLQTHVSKRVKGEMNESSSPLLHIQAQSNHKHGHPYSPKQIVN